MSLVRETKPGQNQRPRPAHRYGQFRASGNSDAIALYEVQNVINGNIEFGDPQDPEDANSATRAGSTATAHNGSLINIDGSWVEATLTATGRGTITCYHNLYQRDADYSVPVTGEPNVRWQVLGVMHDGTGGDGTTTMSLDLWFGGGTVNANSIQLYTNLATGGTAPTIGASNPVLISLFFTRATRGE